MPQEGMQWWHIIVSTHKSWLPGDKRGFRSRDHKVHSSGDYKNPPPIEEHAGLRNYHKHRSGEPAVIPPDQLEAVGHAILAKLKAKGFRVLVVSVAATHSHWLVELPTSYEAVKQIAGECKSKSSHAIRDQLPGRVWASGGDFNRIKDRGHQLNVYGYILKQKDAWVRDYAKEEKQPPQTEEEAQG